MQPLTSSPRDGLSEAEVRRIVEEAPSVTVTAGLEEVSATGATVTDLSDYLVSGSVSRNTYATIHGTCRLTVSTALDWGKVRVRPFVVLTDDETGTAARFDLGVYFLSTPKRVIGTDPEDYEVEGYDRLLALNTHVGRTFAVAAGVNVVEEVRRIIEEEVGETGVLIEASDAVLPAAKVFPLDDKTTWLNVVNDLLAVIGYRGLWADWNGYYRSSTYRTPSTSSSEWTYDADSPTTIVAEERIEEADYFDAPNRWVFIRNNPAHGVASPSGSGVYEVTNPATGATSIDARGRTITKVVPLDAIDDDALQAQGDAIVDRDRRIDTTLIIRTAPNPLHWHADVVTYTDSARAASAKCHSHEWTLPLDGSGDMEHVLREV